MDETDKLVALCKDLCGWLSSQRGMIPKDYAKDLAKLITTVEKQRSNARSVQDNRADCSIV